MPMSKSLQVTGVSFAFGQRQVLNNVSFQVAPGRITILLGPNGAGKTTLFSLISGLLAPQQGSIGLPGVGRAGTAIVFQQPAVDMDLTVEQNLQYHAGLYGLAKKAMWKAVEAPLAHLELQSRLREKVRNLNGGHRRRVEIVRALMTNPSLLLLDEPTAGLDAPTRSALVAYLHKLAKEREMAVLWATHLPDEAADEDDVVLLHEGKVRASGTLADMLKHAKAKALAAAFSKLTGLGAT